MKVHGVKCPTCGAIIYSRARHDFHRCPCGDTAIDGGHEIEHTGELGYERVAGVDPTKVEGVELEVNATFAELYDDWNKNINKYGTLSAEGESLCLR
jgi:predicted RNA-binding Zn-ribbon protein involved in translation (DUF1610 family)